MNSGLPNVLIIGAGFGGLNAAKGLAGAPCNVTLVDRRNHHLFQPLLYQVATAGLSPAQIAAPIRQILRSARNCTVYLDEVVGVDPAKREVTSKKHRFCYDYLVIATGVETNYFSHPEWQEIAPSLKSIEDATMIRRQVLESFENAENADRPERLQQYLTFVIVGGGPTGVELAGAIAELARVTLAQDFRAIDPTRAQVYLIEAGSRVLPTFPEKLSAAARARLEKMGVRVKTGLRVEQITGTSVTTSEGTIECSTVIWAAGVRGFAAAKWFTNSADGRGRLTVDKTLRLMGHENIFVIGDAAAAMDCRTNETLPGVAPVAIQEGKYIAKSIRRALAGRPVQPFQYNDKGMLATVGRSYAVAELAGLTFRGWLAWLLWSVVHILYLIGFKNRVIVAIDWLWSYFTFQRGARLIVGPESRPQHSTSNSN